MRSDLQIRLPPNVADVVDRLAKDGQMDRKEVVRQAVLTLCVILENQADNAAYIASLRKAFGRKVDNG